MLKLAKPSRARAADEDTAVGAAVGTVEETAAAVERAEVAAEVAVVEAVVETALEGAVIWMGAEGEERLDLPAEVASINAGDEGETGGTCDTGLVCFGVSMQRRSKPGGPRLG